MGEELLFLCMLEWRRRRDSLRETEEDDRLSSLRGAFIDDTLMIKFEWQTPSKHNHRIAVCLILFWEGFLILDFGGLQAGSRCLLAILRLSNAVAIFHAALQPSMKDVLTEEADTVLHECDS